MEAGIPPRSHKQRDAASGADNAGEAREARELVGGRYLPGARVGRGRLGEIFEAMDRSGTDFGIERRVALQMVDESVMMGSTRAAELTRCAAALRAAPHPNIVKILHCGRESRAFYVVMELLDGLSLRAVLDDAAPDALSEDDVLAIVGAVGEAVRYLHTKQMVYGRFTPENVFVTADYSVKLLDVPLTHLPRSVPYYVEDLDDSEPYAPDSRDDVYELACLTYELSSGRHPFNANSPLDADRAGLTPAPIETLRLGQWAALQRALARRRADRTPTVADFLAEFGATGARRLRPPLEAGSGAGPGPVSPRDEETFTAQSSAPPPPDTPASGGSPEMLSMSSAYPPEPDDPRDSGYPADAGYSGDSGYPADQVRWAARRADAKRPRRVGRTIAVVGVVAALVGAAAVVNDNRLRAAANDLATRIRSTLAGASADGNEPPIAVAAAPLEVRAADATLDSESTPATAEEPTANPAAVPPAVTAPQAIPPTSPPREDQVAEAGPAPIAEDRVSPNAPVPARTPFVFARSVVTVSESRSSVALTIRRSTAAAAGASVVWWCRDGTAIANKDFADLGRRTETFAPGETSRTIFVPIIMNSRPEANRHFFVDLGEYDRERRSLRVLSTVRVEIDDDD